ncbi:MAG: hypothetical protein K0R67_769 [Paenibacillus sp.]|jgi:hypothetical protein|nr:hypothetical protein [Paenibacillus sp.]
MIPIHELEDKPIELLTYFYYSRVSQIEFVSFGCSLQQDL